MDKKTRLRKRKQAYKIWSRAGGKARFGRIAKEVGLTPEQIRKYFYKDAWQERLEREIALGKPQESVEKSAVHLKTKHGGSKELDQLQVILKESGLNERRQMFILFYLQSFNAKTSAIKAGYSKNTARMRGMEVLKEPHVQEVVAEIKTLLHSNILVSTHDVIDQYVKIAFADITDFVDFNGESVKLKNSEEVDGQLVTEIKQGRDGISIKMADKMKAMERLEKLFEIMPDRKLQLEREKFEFTKELAEDDNKDSRVTIVNDIG